MPAAASAMHADGPAVGRPKPGTVSLVPGMCLLLCSLGAGEEGELSLFAYGRARKRHRTSGTTYVLAEILEETNC